VVEEPNFTLTFLTEDAKRKRIAEEYWAGRREGYSWKWTETVSTIAARYGMQKHLLPAAVREIAKAFDARVKCSECSAPYELTSRSALTTKHWGSYVCSRCREERIRGEQQKRREEEAQSTAQRRAIIAAVSKRGGTGDYDSISYADAVVLYAIALGSDEVYESGVLENAGQLHLCPSEDLTRQLVGHLFRKGLLQFSPDTPTSAVEPGEGGVFSYYPFDVRWRVSPAANGATFPQVFERLGRIIDLRHKYPGYEHSVLDLWWNLALACFIRERTIRGEVESFCAPLRQVAPGWRRL
jgi:DNA-directed RNA polymerase subunit RPC12/RpoP